MHKLRIKLLKLLLILKRYTPEGAINTHLVEAEGIEPSSEHVRTPRLRV